MHTKVIRFTEFRKNASDVLNFVEKGATVRIARHGKIIAKIVPEGSRESAPTWKRKGLRLAAKGASLSKAILDERRSSR
jgi:antitoxin (DNA-binding transcriptional repressor) of toxin-antitoxin stability system